MPRGIANSHMHATKNLRLPLPQLAEIPFCAGDSELRVLSDETLFATCGTRIAFTTHAGGVSEGPYAGLNLSYSVGDDAGRVDTNRRLLCAALDAGNCIESLISSFQVHGSDFIEIRQVVESQRETAGEADGIVCMQSEIPVLLCFADCVPVLRQMDRLLSFTPAGVVPSPASRARACASCSWQHGVLHRISTAILVPTSGHAATKYPLNSLGNLLPNLVRAVMQVTITWIYQLRS